MRDRPAILGGAPVRNAKPPWPQWDEAEKEALDRVLASGRWSASQGSETPRFETDFARFQAVEHCLALTNGTHALEAALAACGIGAGDEVLVPGITFVATATAALAVNAVPVPVDIDPGTLCLDPAAAEAAITSRTRAVITVHIAGATADMDALADLCGRHGLVLIEDAAHAHGTRWKGRGAGSIGAFGCFSFESHKLITAGEGGALTTGSEGLEESAWSYINCGRVPGGHWYHHPRYGSNLRMTEWQAGVLRAQLQRYPAQQRVREERGALLDAELEAIPGIRPQQTDPRTDARARYSYVFWYEPDEFEGLPPAAFRSALAAEGFEVGCCYPSLSQVALFGNGALRTRMPDLSAGARSLPTSEAAAEATVWISHPTLLGEPDEVLDLVRAIARVHSAAGAIRRRLGRNRDAPPVLVTKAGRVLARLERTARRG